MDAPITAATLFDLVTCPHRVAMDRHGPAAKREDRGDIAAMMWRRGVAHEADLLAVLGDHPVTLAGADAKRRERETLAAMDRGEPLILGARIRHEDLVGEPSVLRREDDGYVAGDVRCASADDGPDAARKPRRGYAMQLALYTDILENLDRSAGRYGFIIDGHGEEHVYELDAPRGPRTTVTLWQDYQRLLVQARQIAEKARQTRPARVAACRLCPWQGECLRRLEREDDLSLLPEVGRTARDAIAPLYPTVKALAGADPDELPDEARRLEGIGATMLRRFHDRACLVREPRAKAYLRSEVELPAPGREVFFDVELDALRDHCYLHGFLERVDGGRERYRSFFSAAASDESEEEAFAAAWNHVRGLGDAVLYHYGPLARAAWRDLQERYPQVCDGDEIAELFGADTTVDLYGSVVRPRSEWPLRDYSIASVAGHLGFRWRDGADADLASVAWYESWLHAHDGALEARILAGNEDDCRAVAAVLDGVRGLEVREDA